MSDERVRKLLREIERELLGSGRSIRDVLADMDREGSEPRLSTRARRAVALRTPQEVVDDWGNVARTPGFGERASREVEIWLRWHGLTTESFHGHRVRLCQVSRCPGTALMRLGWRCEKHA